ncbi:exonuclease SbcCD subunit D [Paenibacillus thermoaerophilus]|uniref:Exonuclease SbcCD subunit D n=1 Tax=Paenibacillus thermoaerophilus TaxID=1215385 RepID=A0ABW2V5H8_9BACL|nr:DNA repair exonuclease [Paenibacillus thermoaerophilus]TMV17820.1 DNA repair exonuclease [Paenibacillus thermoaerophilus]
MKAFKFIHAADLHLDSPFVGLERLPEAVRRRIRESTFRALDRLVGIAIEERADAVVIAGDVYDAADRSLRAQLKFQRALETLSERNIPVYISHGNHDPLDGARASLDMPPGVHVFGGAEAECVPVEGGRRGTLAWVHGQSFSTRAVTDNLAAGFARRRSDLFQIGLLHANVDGDPEHDNYAPCRLRDLEASGIDYWALGHVHARRVLSEAPYVVYPGNLQGRSIRETGAKGCYAVEVADSGRASLRFRPADQVRWRSAPVDLTAVRTAQELKSAMEREVEAARRESDGRACVVRFRLKGRSPLYRELSASGGALQELLAEIREREALRAADDEYAFVWPSGAVLEASGMPVDPEAWRGQEGLLGEIVAAADRLAADPKAAEEWARRTLAALLDGKAAVWLRESDKDVARWLLEARELAVAAAWEQLEREGRGDAD